MSDFLKTLPQFIAPKLLLTATAGRVADVTVPAVKNYLIKQFIARYGVNMQEACEENFRNYACFNDFFIRKLKPECRLLAQADVVSPVDGVISEAGNIERGQLLQAKGRYYTVNELLANETPYCENFFNGHFATFYLSPKDYHRIHMPVTATIQKMVYIPGRLFSVQPTTVRVIPALFARNERLAVFCDTALGPMVMVLVGATIVGSIGISWHGELKRLRTTKSFDYSEQSNPPVLQQGEEMGYFKLGSTVILMFANAQNIRWLPTVQAGKQVKYGEALAG